MLLEVVQHPLHGPVVLLGFRRSAFNGKCPEVSRPTGACNNGQASKVEMEPPESEHYQGNAAQTDLLDRLWESEPKWVPKGLWATASPPDSLHASGGGGGGASEFPCTNCLKHEINRTIG